MSAGAVALHRAELRDRVAIVALPLAVVAVVLGAWEVWVRVRDVAPYLLPKPSDIARRVVEERALLFEHFLITSRVMVLGFVVALVASIVVSAAFAYSTTLRRAGLPLVVAAKTVPKIAIAPLLIIWFGYSMTPKVIVTALLCFFPMTVNTVTGLTSVDTETARLFQVLGSRRRDRLFKLDLPTALPYLVTGMKIAAPSCVLGATISEWAGSTGGLGYLILTDTGQVNTVRVFAAIALLSLTGVSFYTLICLVDLVLTPWRRRPQARSSVRARWRWIGDGTQSRRLGLGPATAAEQTTTEVQP